MVYPEDAAEINATIPGVLTNLGLDYAWTEEKAL
jgi:hypothetical protein